MDQSHFFQIVKEKLDLSKEAELKIKIAHILGISESGAYKKINSHTQLTLEEMNMICKYLNLEFDFLESKPSLESLPFLFYCDDLVVPPNTYEQWASNILNHSLHLDRMREDYKVWSYQSEISYFHLLPFRSLLFFKLYTWNRSSWNIPSNTKFKLSEFQINHALNSLLDKINNHYVNYSTIEIWHVDFINGMLNQIKYYHQLNIFDNKDDLHLVIKDVRKLIAHLKSISKEGLKKVFGKKKSNSSISVYLNYTHRSSSLMYIKTPELKMIYNLFLHPNYIRSSNEHVCAYVDSWIEKIIAQSELISKSGELSRIKFFNQLEEKVSILEQEIVV